MFFDKRFEEAEEQVEKLLALLELQGGSVLDLCCGPGRHAIPLTKRGFTVTGVDITPFLIERAKKNALAENVQIEWVLEDMRDFVRPGAYDLVLNMFTSFGYFDNKRDDLRMTPALQSMSSKVREAISQVRSPYVAIRNNIV